MLKCKSDTKELIFKKIVFFNRFVHYLNSWAVSSLRVTVFKRNLKFIKYSTSSSKRSFTFSYTIIVLHLPGVIAFFLIFILNSKKLCVKFCWLTLYVDNLHYYHQITPEESVSDSERSRGEFVRLLWQYLKSKDKGNTILYWKRKP